MKKRIVIPVYKDREKTLGWEKSYLNDSRYEVVVYEKDDNLFFLEEKKTSEGYKIWNDDSLARSSYIFLYHICKNYDSLADVEIFTKTHLHVQKVRIHESIRECHKYNHLDFWNDLRIFIWASEENYNLVLDSFKKSDRWHDGDWAMISLSSIKEILNKDILEKIENEVDFTIDSMDKILPKPEKNLESRDAVKKLKLVFENYKPPDLCSFRGENIWSAKKELILQHPKRFYEEILAKIVQKKDGWDSMCHDDWCIFWPLFWHETMKRRLTSNV